MSRKSFDSQLPPERTAWPIIGNLHQLGQQTLHHVLWEMSKKYGPVIRLWLGSHLLVVVSSAQAAAEFVKVQDKIWASRPPSIAGKIFSCNYRDIVWAPYRNHWRHVRKICCLELSSPKRLEKFLAPRTDQERGRYRICVNPFHPLCPHQKNLRRQIQNTNIKLSKAVFYIVPAPDR